MTIKRVNCQGRPYFFCSEEDLENVELAGKHLLNAIKHVSSTNLWSDLAHRSDATFRILQKVEQVATAMAGEDGAYCRVGRERSATAVFCHLYVTKKEKKGKARALILASIGKRKKNYPLEDYGPLVEDKAGNSTKNVFKGEGFKKLPETYIESAKYQSTHKTQEAADEEKKIVETGPRRSKRLKREDNNTNRP
jgi:YHS domain-containing protein